MATPAIAAATPAATPEPSFPIPPSVPTILGDYAVIVDGHFSIDIDASWERKRENGDDNGVLLRATKRSDRGIVGAVINLYRAQRWQDRSDDHMRYYALRQFEDFFRGFHVTSCDVNNLLIDGIAAKRATITWTEADPRGIKGVCYIYLLIFDNDHKYGLMTIGSGRYEADAGALPKSIQSLKKAPSTLTKDS